MKHLYFLICLFIWGVQSLFLEDSLSLGVGIDRVYTSVAKDNYGYFGTFTSPGYVVKVDLSNQTRVGYILLEQGEDNLSSSVIYGDCAYFGTMTGYVVKVNLTTFTRVESIDSTLTNLQTVIVYNNFAIFGGYERIVKINLEPFSFVKTRVVSLYWQLTESVLYDNFGYFACINYIYKYNLDTLILNDTLFLGIQYPNLAYFDYVTLKENIAYFGTNNPVYTIVPIDLITFTSNKTNSRGASSQYYCATTIGNYLVFGGYYSSFYDSSNTTAPTNNIIMSTSSISGSMVQTVVTYNNTLFYGINSSPGAISAVNQSNLLVKTISLDTLNAYLGASAFYKGYAYYIAGTTDFPNKLLKIDLSTFQLVNTIQLQYTEMSIPSMYIYEGSLYLTNYYDTTSIEIDLDIFARSNTYPSYFQNRYATYTVVDGLYSYSAFAYLNVNTYIYKINLQTHQPVRDIYVGMKVQYLMIYGNYLYISAADQLGLVKFFLSS